MILRKVSEREKKEEQPKAWRCQNCLETDEEPESRGVRSVPSEVEVHASCRGQISATNCNIVNNDDDDDDEKFFDDEHTHVHSENAFARSPKSKMARSHSTAVELVIAPPWPRNPTFRHSNVFANFFLQVSDQFIHCFVSSLITPVYWFLAVRARGFVSCSVCSSDLASNSTIERSLTFISIYRMFTTITFLYNLRWKFIT